MNELTVEQLANLSLKEHFQLTTAFLAGSEPERFLMEMAYHSGVLHGLERYIRAESTELFMDSALCKEIEAMRQRHEDMELPVSGDEWKQK